MHLLNDDHKNAVEEMGFGSLLHFKLSYTPAKRAFKILDHFDLDTCGIVYQRGILHGYEDVQATLGLLKGSIGMVRNEHQTSNKFIGEIAYSGGQGRSNMGATFLANKLLSDTEGGEMFRKIFLILVDTVLINPSGGDGYLHTQIEEVIHDINHVKEYNWCGYVIHTLLMAHRKWAENKDKSFIGSISFPGGK